MIVRHVFSRRVELTSRYQDVYVIIFKLRLVQLLGISSLGQVQGTVWLCGVWVIPSMLDYDYP